MNKMVRWIIGCAAFLLACLVLYLKLNPPLASNGYGWSSAQPGLVTVELQNESFHGVKLKKVFVNEGGRPCKVDLGVSRSSALIGIFALKEEIDGISFHPIDEYEIEPKLNREEVIELEELDNRSTIRHYGLAVDHCKKVDSVTVKYTYFGFPYKKEIKIERME
ncbi:hypothetical protein KJK41_03005 [Bacillus haikouensis]|nr:hypothetical protein KJK41_03005 [Bacillus haikouensis]